jgi:hypothetical protein
MSTNPHFYFFYVFKALFGRAPRAALTGALPNGQIGVKLEPTPDVEQHLEHVPAYKGEEEPWKRSSARLHLTLPPFFPAGALEWGGAEVDAVGGGSGVGRTRGRWGRAVATGGECEADEVLRRGRRQGGATAGTGGAEAADDEADGVGRG